MKRPKLGTPGNRSFGPAIVLSKDDGALSAVCTYCCFHVGDSCTHNKPSRIIPNYKNTPDWCEMKTEMLDEAKKKLTNVEIEQADD